MPITIREHLSKLEAIDDWDFIGAFCDSLGLDEEMTLAELQTALTTRSDELAAQQPDREQDVQRVLDALERIVSLLERIAPQRYWLEPPPDTTDT